MKAKDWEAKRNMSVPELQEELRQTVDKRFRLKFKHRVAKVKNPLELRTLRRHAARLQTLVNEKSVPEQSSGRVAKEEPKRTAVRSA